MEQQKNTKKLKRLAITCGGTGGHFNPGLSIAQELNASGGEAILLLGGRHAEKQLKIAENCGVKAYRITASLTPSIRHPFRIFSFLRDLLRGGRESVKILRAHQCEALLSMGSYTALPPYCAAKALKLPFFLHDGNARLGKSNLLMSRTAKAFALSFPAVNQDKVKCPSALTGFPIREALLKCTLTREEAIAKINDTFGKNFSAEDPVLLVMGGSLGAEKINSNICLNNDSLQVIHLAGPGKLEAAQACYTEHPSDSSRLLLLESCEDMAMLYTAADFVISRAGGSTVAELAFFGKYAMLIPYPFAADLHQNNNAEWFVSGGGAEITWDKDCSKELFAGAIARWQDHRAEYQAKGAGSKALAQPDAAGNVIRMIETHLP